MDAELTQHADSSTANPIESLTPDQMHQWRMTGELPEPETAESATAPTSEEVEVKDGPETDAEAKTPEKAAPDPEPGKPKPEGEKPRRDNADTRIKELLGERKALRGEVETLKAKVAQMESGKQGSQPARGAETVDDGEPKSEDFDTYEAYLDARSDWKAAKKAEEAIEAYKAEQIATQRQEKLNGKWGEIRQNHADLDELIEANAETMFPVDLANHLLLEHDLNGAVIHHLAANPEEAERISKLDIAGQAYALGKIEAQLTAPKPVAPEPEPPPAKPKAAPPPPPTVLKGANAPPRNEAEAALVSGDFAAYQAARNREEVTARSAR